MIFSMQKHPIAAVVNFCTNESRFIKACIEQTSFFSPQIVIPVCDHFFDGTPENRSLLEKIYSAFPNCYFIEYPFIQKQIPSRIWKKIDAAHFWHSLSRLIGYSFLEEDIDTVLFLDADEIPDGRRFAEWLECSDYQYHTVMKMANYWYFREPCHQSLRYEDSVVLAHRRALSFDLLLKEEEREAIYSQLPCPKRRHVTGVDGQPMFHHYSWVRTKEEMLKKVMSWGHKGDRNWAEVVQKEFEQPFSGTDFVHGYTFKKIDPLFDIRLEEVSFEGKGAPRVKRLSADDVLELIHASKNSVWEWISRTFFR